MTKSMSLQQAVFMFGVLLAAGVTAVGEEPSLRVQLILLTGLVILTALPHGALDPLVANRAGMWRGAAGLSLFLASYGLVACVVMFAWRVWPGYSLGVFLILSAWHFSKDWEDTLATAYRIGVGTAVIALPAYFHTAETNYLFAQLAPVDAASSLTNTLAVLAPAALAVVIIASLRSARRAAMTSVELLGLAVASYLFPPLLFFTLYFCLQHSPRHLLRVARHHDFRNVVITASVLTAVTVLAGVYAWYQQPIAAIDERLLRIVFVGLAALTVPHMLLIAYAGQVLDAKVNGVAQS